jgi:hypothetical protein
LLTLKSLVSIPLFDAFGVFQNTYTLYNYSNLQQKVVKNLQTIIKNKRGVDSDKLLLDTINQYPGLSQYELGRKMKWHSGHVDGAIRRLFNQNLITIKGLERNGRTVNLIYPKDTKPQDIIEVKADYLTYENGEWQNQAYVYALDSTTIGITGTEIPEWKEYAAFTAVIPIKRQNDMLILQLPEKFKTFYQITRKHRVAGLSSNTILVTVSGTLVEVKKYPA